MTTQNKSQVKDTVKVRAIPGRFITGRFITGRFNTVGSSCGRFITRSIQHRSIHPRARKQLAHVFVEDVLDAFEELATATTPGHGRVAYFEHTCIRGRRLPGRRHNYRSALFPPASWNKRESATQGITRTINICEGWRNSFQSFLLCNHPSMWTFFDGIMKEIDCNANCQFPPGNC